MRARKALQYANSIDQYVQIMLDGNNGGYANDWLLADNNTGEIARFELGLKMHRVWRTKDGYYVGANFPSDPAFTKAETDFNPRQHGQLSQCAPQALGGSDARRTRARSMSRMGEKFLADHWDTYEGKEDRNLRGLCGHGDSFANRRTGLVGATVCPMGAVTAQAADSTMAQEHDVAGARRTSLRRRFHRRQVPERAS